MFCHLHQVSFSYTAPYVRVFDALTLSLDASWRTAIVGANGRGKTTLARLLAGTITPDAGTRTCTVRAITIPPISPHDSRPLHAVQRHVAGPYDAMEERLAVLAQDGSEEALHHWAAVVDAFEAAGGWTIDASIADANARFGIANVAPDRPFNSLSGGEQTRALLAAAFAPPDTWPILDEPTNHLDADGCRSVAQALRDSSRGFVVVSHNTSFLGDLTDHIISIEPDGVHTLAASYATWHIERQAQLSMEERRQAGLARNVAQLRTAAHDARRRSNVLERSKNAAHDSGFISRKAADVMKRALAVERRIERSLHDAEVLLARKEADLALNIDLPPATAHCSLIEVAPIVAGRPLCAPITLHMASSPRIVLMGPNGSGKSALLRCLVDGAPHTGTVYKPARLRIGVSPQHPVWQTGSFDDHVRSAGLDANRMRTLLAAVGMRSIDADRPLETLSFGQLKKIDLIRTLCSHVELLVWDEPFNGLDPASVEALVAAIRDSVVPMLIVDHDAHRAAAMDAITVTLTVPSGTSG